MSKAFEELDFQKTPLGDLILRRRQVPSLGNREVYEVKLGEAFLMSSLFHEVEVALANLGLGELQSGLWDVVVGGLGLGYTLLHPRHGRFYSLDGLRRLASHLLPGGVFALWSDDPPEDEFLELLSGVFTKVKSEVVTFENPLLERDSASTVYVASL
ncbi:MAG: hypothetical protein EBR81_02380 [Proteobacteria bacterium]|nr:hypothetical protein [Pseudomonadota bacterium]